MEYFFHGIQLASLYSWSWTSGIYRQSVNTLTFLFLLAAVPCVSRLPLCGKLATRSMIWLGVVAFRFGRSLFATSKKQKVKLVLRKHVVAMFSCSSSERARASFWLHGKALRRLCLKRSSAWTLGFAANFWTRLDPNLFQLVAVSVFPIFRMDLHLKRIKKAKNVRRPGRAVVRRQDMTYRHHHGFIPFHDMVSKVQLRHCFFVRRFAFIWFSLKSHCCFL